MSCVVAAIVVTAARSEALIEYGDARIAGYLYSQNVFQHDGIDDHWEFAQSRNLLNFTFEYRFLKRGVAFDGFRIPGIDSATLYLEYRGAYDPVFALRDDYKERWESDIRSRLERENELREVYLDFATGAVGPGRLNVRIGRQQVVWGEADVVRSLDVINPLDLRRQFLLGPDQPNLDEFRVPLWMLKLNYAMPQLGPVANFAFETIYIPGDITPLQGRIGEVTSFPFDMERRPSSQPFRRVRHPFEITRIGPGFTEVPGQAVVIIPSELVGVLGLPEDLGGVVSPVDGALTIPADIVWFDKNDPFQNPVKAPLNDVPSRAWIDHAEVGARMLGQFTLLARTFDFSLNYFYTYSDIPGAFADFPAVAAALFSTPGARNAETGAGLTFAGERDLGNPATIWVPAALEYPRTHIFGGTLTYSDIDWTGAIWRLEVSHQTEDPRIKPRPPFLAEREGEFTFDDFTRDFRATGATTRGMLGADLFRSFPFLDSILGGGQPFFISGQAFVEYKEDISNTIGTLLDVNDHQKRWNPLYTLLVQYFAKGGRWVPVLIALYDQDPQHLAVAPMIEYHPRNWLTFKVGQIWFTGSRLAQSSRFLHPFADRDHTFFRIQYAF